MQNRTSQRSSAGPNTALRKQLSSGETSTFITLAPPHSLYRFSAFWLRSSVGGLYICYHNIVQRTATTTTRADAGPVHRQQQQEQHRVKIFSSGRRVESLDLLSDRAVGDRWRRTLAPHLRTPHLPFGKVGDRHSYVSPPEWLHCRFHFPKAARYKKSSPRVPKVSSPESSCVERFAENRLLLKGDKNTGWIQPQQRFAWKIASSLRQQQQEAVQCASNTNNCKTSEDRRATASASDD